MAELGTNRIWKALVTQPNFVELLELFIFTLPSKWSYFKIGTNRKLCRASAAHMDMTCFYHQNRLLLNLQVNACSYWTLPIFYHQSCMPPIPRPMTTAVISWCFVAVMHAIQYCTCWSLLLHPWTFEENRLTQSRNLALIYTSLHESSG